MVCVCVCTNTEESLAELERKHPTFTMHVFKLKPEWAMKLFLKPAPNTRDPYEEFIDDLTR
jgi:hypothetical protein